MMEKLVVIKLEGYFERGFQATLEIGPEGARPDAEIIGHLPPAHDLLTDLANWQSIYRRLKLSSRAITDVDLTVDNAIRQQCQDAARELRDRLNTWLRSKPFQPIREKWLETLNKSDQVRVIIRTESHLLRQLPWHLWDLLERYPFAEIGLSTHKYERPPITTVSTASGKVIILAILGNSSGIQIEKDRQFLEALPNARITFLVEPERQELNRQLWEQPWDVIFFAGHSETEGATGRIYINKTESLAIDELREALRKAITSGLQLAIFNSCDGWGLASNLAALNIPQMVIMQEPVPDEVAHQFLKDFLQAFAGGQPLYRAVQDARRKLQGLEDKCPCASWLPVICQNPAVVPPNWQQLRRPKRRRNPTLLPASIASLTAALLVLMLRHLGMFQSWELKTFDHLMRLRPNEGSDPRLLIVEATEEDLNRYGFPLPDATLAQALEQLVPHQPRVIGLNIFRDRPVEPSYLQQNSRLVALCSVREADKPNKPGIAPPPALPPDRLGFSDVVVDADGVLRRHLMFMQPHHSDPCKTNHAFSNQIAFQYLAAAGLEPQLTPENDVQLGQVVFKDLSASAGGYQQLDDRGFQVMLNYRASKAIAQQVTLTDVLSGRVNPEWVQDRAILIGVTAPVSSNAFATPYSAGKHTYHRMSGVLVQAHKVSQILSAALDRRPLLWTWPHWGEAIWIAAWSAAGGIIAWRCHRGLSWLLVTGMMGGTLYGICLGLLLQGGWIPLVPAEFVLIASGGSAIAYTKVRSNIMFNAHSQSRSKG